MKLWILTILMAVWSLAAVGAEFPIIARDGDVDQKDLLNLLEWDDGVSRLEITGGFDASASSLYRAGTPGAGDILTSSDSSGTLLWQTPAGLGIALPANPTASVDGTVVNGAAATFMRSDAAPPLANPFTIASGVQTFNGRLLRIISSSTKAEFNAMGPGDGVNYVQYSFQADLATDHFWGISYRTSDERLEFEYDNGGGGVAKFRLETDGDAVLAGNFTANNFSGSSSGTNTGNVTLGADADVLLGLTGQALSLDSQNANLVLASPDGAPGDPTFRALVSADIPDPYTPPDGTWNLAGNHQIENAHLKFTQLTAPTAPAATATGSGGSLAAGSFYKWWVTFVTAEGETELGTASNVPTTVLNDSVDLTSVPLGATGTTARKIYRNTDANQTEFRLVTTINDNVTTTYSDGASDASLGARLWLGNTTGGRLYHAGSPVFTSTYDAQSGGALVIGNSAGPSTIGGANVMLGPLAGATATAGQAGQTLIGYGAGRYLGAAADINNVAVGSGALGQPGATTEGTIAIGNRAGESSVDRQQVFIGDQAGRYNGAGRHNVAVGAGALLGVAPQPADSGPYNVAIGGFSMWKAKPVTEDGIKGGANTAIGGLTLEDVTDGIGNLAVGFGAGLGATGEGGANSVRTSDFCGFLGYNSGQSGALTLQNAWAIGRAAVVGVSNTMVIGESSTYPIKVILYDSLQIGNAASVSYNRFGTTATGHGLSGITDLKIDGLLEVDSDIFGDSDLIIADDITGDRVIATGSSDSTRIQAYSTAGDATTEIRNDGNGNYSALRFVRERSSGANVGSAVIRSISNTGEVVGRSDWIVNSSIAANVDNVLNNNSMRISMIGGSSILLGAPITFYRGTATAARDVSFNFDMNDDQVTPAAHTYAQIRVMLKDPTNTSEDGELEIWTSNAGTITKAVTFTNDQAMALVGGATIGKTTTFTPSAAQAITAVGSTILANATVIVLNPDADYTLTSAPTIANGTTGQIVYVTSGNGEANTVTVQDQDSLASSNLQLGAASRAIGARDVLTLIFDGADWIEQSYANN